MTHRRRATWVVAALLAGAAGWYVAFVPAYHSYLAMPMKVRVERPAGATRIKAIWLMSDYRRSPGWERIVADEGIANKWIAAERLWKADPFDGNAIDFRVPGDDSGSLLGVTLSYTQHGHLLVVAELADGRWVATVADIPDARTTREMRVVLP